MAEAYIALTLRVTVPDDEDSNPGAVANHAVSMIAGAIDTMLLTGGDRARVWNATAASASEATAVNTLAARVDA